MTTQSKSDAMRQMEKAIASLVISQPFYGCLALKLKLVQDDSGRTQTASVDGVSLRFNGPYVLSLPFAQLVGLTAHEIMHCAQGHQFRLGAREFRDANRAADLEINPLLVKSGFTLFDGALTDPLYQDGQSFEFIYGDIQRRKPKPQESPSPAPQDGAGDDADDESADDDAPQDDSNGAPSDKPDDSESDDSAGDDAGQSPADGQGKPDDDASATDGDGTGQGDGAGAGSGEPAGPEMIGEVLPMPGETGDATPAEIAQAESDWRMAVVQAGNVARAVGKLPGHIAKLIEEIKKPRYDGEEIFRNLISSVIKSESTWSRPNKRYMPAGFYMPTPIPGTIGELVIGVDISASVSREMRDLLQGWVNGVVTDLRPDKVTVIYCDTRIPDDGVREFELSDMPVTIDSMIGGGTSFVPVFEYVEREDIRPAALVYLTDLEAYRETFPAVAPDYPVIWVSALHSAAPFGDVVTMQHELGVHR